MRILPFVILLGFFTACQNTSDTPPPPGNVHVSGNIENNQIGNLVFIQEKEQHQALIQDGTFDIKFHLEKPNLYLVRYGNHNFQVYLSPGDHLKVNFDAQRINQSLSFEGDGAENNEYLKKINELEKTNMGQLNAAFRKPVEQFKEDLHSVKEKYLSLYEEYEDKLSPYYRKTAKADIKYGFANRKLLYPRYHGMYSQEEVDLSTDYYSFLDDLDVNNSNLLTSEQYKQFLSTYLAYLAEDKNKLSGKQTLNEVEQKFELISSHFNDRKVKDYLMYNLIKSQFRYSGVNKLTEVIERFLAEAETPDYKTEIQGLYDKWASLLPGKPAPSFQGVNAEGNPVSSEDLKGSYAYIDVWATWCAPCRKEIPFLEELQEEFKDQKQVKLVSISIDRNKTAWENMIREKNMQGMQWYLDQEEQKQLAADYNISGIPRFMIIDPQGNIFNAHAPRPSSGEVGDLLRRISSES